MSDYIPTTEEVRLAYGEQANFRKHATQTFTQGFEEEDGEFDRWLAEVKAEACTHTFAQQLEEHSLAELIRIAKADAWDEGHVSSDDYYGEHDNPYRQGETE